MVQACKSKSEMSMVNIHCPATKVIPQSFMINKKSVFVLLFEGVYRNSWLKSKRQVIP
jgi:hypothetical protein